MVDMVDMMDTVDTKLVKQFLLTYSADYISYQD
jgi:hypothetical protein